ncbi:MAG: phosphate/phosphite/phosphonate ABC transporter substrate-binding protein [Pseudomonadota bacterium]
MKKYDFRYCLGRIAGRHYALIDQYQLQTRKGMRMSRRSFLQTMLVAGCAAACPGLSLAQQRPLRMAVHPYNSTLALVATHRPLQKYLEATLQHPVEFYTAASFDAFIAALMAGEYDIAISPPHFAMIALEKGIYAPLVHYKSRLEPLLVVPKDSVVRHAADFAGKRIAMADRTAFIRIVVLQWLASAGLEAGRDYQIVERPSHGASITATVLGEADAGLATTTTMRQVPADIQAQVRILTTGLKFPHLFTLANKRLGAPMIARLQAALLGLTAEHPEGRVFFEKTGFGGYEEVGAEELAALKPYVAPTRRVMGLD